MRAHRPPKSLPSVSRYTQAMNSAEFFNVQPVAQALQSLLAHWHPTPALVSLDPREAMCRALAQDVHAPEELPAFARSTVDGYALRAADSYGASPALPALLRVAGELRMGEAAQQSLTSGNALLIHTGGMLPPGADAVIMLERTQTLGDDVELLAPVAPGENVLQPGEDVAAGALLVAGRADPAGAGGWRSAGGGRHRGQRTRAPARGHPQQRR